MELKKYPEADVTRKSDIYFMIGLVFALAVIFMAFAYRTSPEPPAALPPPTDDASEEVMDITRQDKPAEPPPPPPQTIDVVADDADVEETDIKSTETTQDEVVQQTVQQEVKVEEKTDEPEYFTIVEEMPEFPGGQAKMYEFIAKNLVYPPNAKENGIQGRVVVQFMVKPDGSISDVTVVKDLGWGTGEEAARVIKMMPRWKPGKQRNKAVQVRYSLPIKFQLE